VIAMTTNTLPAVAADRALRVVGGARLSDAAAKAASTDPRELLRRWFAALSSASVRKYSQALDTFGAWAILDGDRGPEAVLRLLCDAGPAAAHAMAEEWRDGLLAAGKAPSTVAGLLSAIASLVRACRRVGLVAWSLEGVAPKPEKRCDRRGPPRHEVELLLARLDEKGATGDRRAIRDAAIVRLLHNAALRRDEVCNLRFPQDVDLDAGDGPTVMPRRKGKTERARVLIGAKAAASLREWILSRGTWAGPLFVRVKGAGETETLGPLSGESVRLLVRSRAQQAGCKATCRPHGMRHASATEVARRGSLAELQALGQWQTLSAAAHYLDERAETRQRAIGLVEV